MRNTEGGKGMGGAEFVGKYIAWLAVTMVYKERGEEGRLKWGRGEVRDM